MFFQPHLSSRWCHLQPWFVLKSLFFWDENLNVLKVVIIVNLILMDRDWQQIRGHNLNTAPCDVTPGWNCKPVPLLHSGLCFFWKTESVMFGLTLKDHPNHPPYAFHPLCVSSRGYWVWGRCCRMVSMWRHKMFRAGRSRAQSWRQSSRIQVGRGGKNLLIYLAQPVLRSSHWFLGGFLLNEWANPEAVVMMDLSCHVVIVLL